jgi:8-amino-7-oxononanoate synthase
LIRAFAHDSTRRGGRRLPSARQAATVRRSRTAIDPQQPQLLMCCSIARRRAGVTSPSMYRDSSINSLRQRLEEAVAAFTGRERALVYSTGYMANMGVIGALADQKSSIVSDKLNHASLIDGCRVSGAEVARYRHVDVDHVAELLASIPPAATPG